MPLRYESVLDSGPGLAAACGLPFRHGAQGEHLQVKKIDGSFEPVYTKESPLRPLIIALGLLTAMLPLSYSAFSRLANFD